MNCNHEQYNNFRKKMIQRFDFEIGNPIGKPNDHYKYMTPGSGLNNGEIFEGAAQQDSLPIGDLPYLAPTYIYTQRVDFLEMIGVPYLIASIGSLRFTKPNVLEDPYGQWQLEWFFKHLWEKKNSMGFAMIPARFLPKTTKKDQKLIDHRIFDFTSKDLDFGNHTKLDMIKCNAGSFEIPSDPPYISDDGKLVFSGQYQRQTTKVISKPFRMSSVEITQGLFQRIMNDNQFDPLDARFHVKMWKIRSNEPDYTYDPYHYIVNNYYGWNAYHDRFGDRFRTFQSQMVGNDKPVVNVSLEEIFVFCNRLSQLQGLEPCYQLQYANADVHQYGKNLQEILANLPKIVDHTKNGFRLPTVAEWQCAALAGKITAFTETDSLVELAKYAHLNIDDSNIHPTIIDVAQKRPNSWGFYDMNGNVGEICIDGVELKVKPEFKNQYGIPEHQTLDYRNLHSSALLLLDIYPEIQSNTWYEWFGGFKALGSSNTQTLYVLGGSVLTSIKPNLWKITKTSGDIEDLKRKNEEILNTFRFRVENLWLGMSGIQLSIDKGYMGRHLGGTHSQGLYTNYVGFRIIQNCM